MRLIYILLIVFLFIFPIYFATTFYRIDKLDFVNPINYGNRPIPIRVDLAGNGHFAAKRNGRRKHNGIDILADMDEAVYAPLGGIVINSEYQQGLGNYVEIKHNSNNLLTIYAHLSKRNVVQGQFVRQGEVIGFVGKTGNAYGNNISPHLHFEMYRDGELIDPNIYLK